MDKETDKILRFCSNTLTTLRFGLILETNQYKCIKKRKKKEKLVSARFYVEQ
jgi:hypothetical protein